MTNRIHIVCLDAPSPPDYGGAIDMYYKVKAIAETGKRIILHYFQYNPVRGAGELGELCEEVHSYSRKGFFSLLNSTLPFIVSSRINKDLINRLNSDNEPILLEGLHTSGIIPFLNDPHRVVLRMHNEEANYYENLYKAEPSFLKRLYFKREAGLIKKYQSKMNSSIRLACLSSTDMKVFASDFGFKDIHFIPCFIPWQEFTAITGRGSFCLYQGNMAISENVKAALWLVENVFSKVNVPFVISGNRIPSLLVEKTKGLNHIRLISDPSIPELEELIQKAHINVLPSMNSTGVKLKLLHALFSGRFCITNLAGSKGSGIDSGIFIAETADEFRSQVIQLMESEFTREHIDERKTILPIYNNRINAEKLNALY
jgi:glycosyltransferase involved in cell wall biosynthesis